MDAFHAEEGTVIPFSRFASAGAVPVASCLTPHDRMDISDWRDLARTAGYDRMVIHNRDDGDAQEVGNFLSVYRSGQSWSRWGFARQGGIICGWCCLTSIDMGQFDTLSGALAALLIGGVSVQGSLLLPAGRRGAVVTALADRRRACSQSLNSAA